MTKRIVSIVLCLIMALSVVAPVAQASDVDLGYGLDSIFGGAIVGDNVQLDNVVIDGNTVGTNHWLTGSADPDRTPDWDMPQLPNLGEVCNCDECETVADHTSGCIVKAELNKLCAGTAEDLFAQWADFAADEKAYMLQYMQENYSGRFADFQKLLNAPTGFDSETFKDGTTVSVQGIPEDGRLTIKEATEEVKEIVEKYAEKNSSSAVEVFNFDISVQDGKGADWQPETSVKMELDVPGVKLHKYAKVYVVHVDDNGVASTIEASVTEDGKIAFETPGFSTFAGFTVDFEYGDAYFSIPGLTSIKLSEIFDELKMPLYTEDVQNVVFSNEELIKVEALDGDWLLTSLKAFSTTEALTITMNNGKVYEIKVTDADPYIYVDGVAYYDDDNNNTVTWRADGDGNLVQWDGWSQYYATVIGGGGEFDIHLQAYEYNDGTYMTYETLYINLYQLIVRGGTKVNVTIMNQFDSATKEVYIRPRSQYTQSLFVVEEGELHLVGREGVNMVISGRNASDEDGYYTKNPLIYLKSGCTAFTATYCDFRQAANRAICVQSNAISNFELSNCIFRDTVRCKKYGGGAIYIDGGTSGSTGSVVDIDVFKMTNCTFNSNTSASHGGAIQSKGDIGRLEIDGCSFKNCTSTARGGAMEFSTNEKTAGNHIFDWFKISNTTFSNCTAGSHGGAIDISCDDDKPVKLNCSPTFEGCTFTTCKATGNRGGAIRMVVGTTARDLTITDSGFSGCTAGSAGGAISVQGTIGNISISGGKTDDAGKAYTFKNCSSNDHGGALLIDCTNGCGNISTSGATFTGNTCAARGAGVAILCPTVGNVTLTNSSFSSNTAGTLGGGFFVGIRASATSTITVGDVSVTGCTFSNNTANGVGGGLSLTDGTYNSITVQTSTFTDCYAANYGGGIGMKTYADDATEKFPFKVTNNVQILDCSFSGCTAGGLSPEPYDDDGDPNTEKKETWDHDGDSSTAEIIRLNGTGGGGAIAIGGEIGGTVTIKSTGANNNTAADNYTAKFNNCHTWNNGGAVCFLGTVKTTRVDMQYVDFNGCRSRDAGGAVYLSNAIIDDLKMDTCTVRNCSYFTSDFDIDIPGTAYDSLGKAVYTAYDASGTIRCIGNTTCRAWLYNCTIKDNDSYSNGGGVYWNANNVRTGAAGTTIEPSLKIEWCVLSGNHAHRDGGALYVEATVNVMGGKFSNNVADGRGGAIAQQVYNNDARKLGESGSDEATNLILNSATEIWGNTATNGGGISITVAKTVSVDDDKVVIYPVKFTLGGAQVYNNWATENGGGIYYSTSQYSDKAEQREVDNFQKEILINGGKIYGNKAGTTKNNKGEFVASETGGCGGGIYMNSNQVNTGAGTGYSKVTISNGSIDSNVANKGNGGGIYLTGKNALCTVTGGIIGFYLNDDGKEVISPNVATPVETDQVDAIGNKIWERGNGGGIAVFGGARIEMTGGQIFYNEAYVGGGIAVRDGSSMLSDKATDGTSGEVKYNNATSAGGGIVVGDKSTMTINEGTVSYNKSNNGGGIAILAGGDASTIGTTDEKWGMLFNNGTISYNLSHYYGGGVLLSAGAIMKLSGGTITQNYAAQVTNNEDGTVTYTYTENHQGGGIAVCQGSRMDIDAGTISNNYAYYGGGIVVRGSGSAMNMSGGSIKTNEAVSGGGITALGDFGKEITQTTIRVKGGMITENHATGVEDTTGQGGGIHADGNVKITFGASTVNGKKTVGSIDHNTAAKGGGVYVANGADLTVSDGFIIFNTASGKPAASFTTANKKNDGLQGVGGGVYVADGCNVEMSGYSAIYRSEFTLSGVNAGIYGNLADFAADDVFANGNLTKLDVLTKAAMDLSNYKFKPEGWFEDYPANDSEYENGLSMAPSDTGITNGKVFRYRGSDPLQRVLINDSDIGKVNTANTYVAMTLGMPTAVNDTVVIDYGKPVNIQVLKNEIMNVANSPMLQGIGTKFTHVEGEYGYATEKMGYGTSYTTAFGTITADTDEGVVTFTMNSMSMDKEVMFSYAVKYSNSKDANNNNEYFYYYADVTIIPATTIYYEDSFSGITYSDGWAPVSEGTAGDAVQNEDRPGSALDHEIDADNVYGYDGSYKNCLKYSMGSAHKVTVGSGHAQSATASFTFKGTGFDVISLTSSTSGTIVVAVDDLSIENTGENKDVVEYYYIVDTYYGYTRNFYKVTYKYDGSKWVAEEEQITLDKMGTSQTKPENPVKGNKYIVYEARWDVTPVANNALYQIPVMKVSDLDYGEYTVTITATYADFFDNAGKGSYDFYLDAIRIYDPANDGEGNEVIEDTYVTDGEGWPSYQELRNLLIDKGTFDSIGNGEDVINGIVFIDGIPSMGGENVDNNTSVKDENDNELNKTAQIKTYINFGPNNELYLAKGQAVAFALTDADTIAKVQLGLKSLGKSATVKVGYYENGTITWLEWLNDEGNLTTDKSIATATDMYYDISALAGKTVVIQNASAADGDVLSITNIKTTYTEKPATFSLLRAVRKSEIEDVVAALNVVEDDNQPEQNVPGAGGENNPQTGDMVSELLTMTLLTSCVMMLAVLVLPGIRKRNAK